MAVPPASPGRKAREGAVAQRIRVGALGLAGVFLLVILAAALLRATSDSSLANGSDPVAGNVAAPAEPLAQLGVAPGNVPADASPTPVAPPPTRSKPATR